MGWGNRKPPFGTPVNWGHPLAAGLVAVWPFNEGAGDRTSDLSISGPGTPVIMNTSTKCWDAGHFYIPSSSDSAQTGDMPAYLRLQPPLTMAWVGQAYGAWASGGNVMAAAYTNPDGAPWFSLPGFNRDPAGGQGVQFETSNSGSELRIQMPQPTFGPPGAISAPEWRRQFASIVSPTVLPAEWGQFGGSARIILYVNGITGANGFSGAQSTSSITISYTSSSFITMSGPARHEAAHLYSIVLAPITLDWLYAEPFAMFADRRRNSTVFLMTTTPISFYDPVGIGGGLVGKQASLVG